MIVIARYAAHHAEIRDPDKRMVGEQQPTHQTYLLRLWRDAHDQVWRASLRTTASDQEVAFATLDELFVHLLRQTEAMKNVGADAAEE